MKETLDYEGLSNLNKLYSIQVQATVSQTNFTNILLKKNFCTVCFLKYFHCIFVEDTLYFSNVHSEFRTIRSTLQRGEQAVSFYL